MLITKLCLQNFQTTVSVQMQADALPDEMACYAKFLFLVHSGILSIEIELCHEKTCILHMREQMRRSAAG